MTMKTNEVLQFVQDHDTFLITYYAKKQDQDKRTKDIGS